MSKLTLPLEVGKKYIRRDGSHATCIKIDYGYNPPHAKLDGTHYSDVFVDTGRANYVNYPDYPGDIVADYVEAEAHPHAENMRLYAEDAAKTRQPWMLWEASRKNYQNDWYGLIEHPLWSEDFLYRRKPETIKVNGLDVPKPESVAPPEGTQFFYPSFTCGYLFATSTIPFSWQNDSLSNRVLELGFLHLTKEGAIAHAKALLAHK